MYFILILTSFIAAFISGAAGTFAANRVIRNMEKGKFQIYISILLCIVGVYMLIFGG